MHKKHFKLFSAFAIVLVAVTSAAQYSIVPGRTTEKPEILDKKDIGPFKYEAVDVEYWQSFNEALDEGNFVKAAEISADIIEEEKDTSTDEAEEAKLGLGIALSKLKITFGASILFQELAKSRNGTKIGEAALYELDQIAQNYFYEIHDIGEDLLISNEFAPMHPDVESFIGYHAGLYNLTAGFKAWSDKEFKKIRPETYWDYQLKYLRAIGELSREKFDSSLKMMEELHQTEKLPERLKNQVKLQLARLKFELNDFEGAYNLYYGLNLPTREKGRVYLERAWTKFYQKDYSKALGLLAVSETPMYSNSISYENFILKMLIYRELCHYEAVSEAAQSFRDRFGQAIKDIKNRKDLEKNKEIAGLVLLNERFQKEANFIQQIRQEYREFLDFDWDDYPFFERLKRVYEQKDIETQTRLARELPEAARKVASDILDAEEQVNYLDYSAKLDSLRIVRKGENRNYMSEIIPHLTFEKFYWPVSSEHWYDELEDYQVFIKSRCGESQFTRPEEDDAPEEFK